MNNTCPSCGATYNITAAMIGREVVCKKCNSELVITEAGIELKDAPPPPPARRGSSASNAAPSRRPVAPARVEEEPEEEDYDEEESPAPRKSSRYGKSGGGRKLRSSSSDGNGFLNFATFRMLIAPTVISVVFWLASGFAVLYFLRIMVLSIQLGFNEGALYALAAMILVPFLVRLYCELIIVAFRIYTTLGEILTELKSQR